MSSETWRYSFFCLLILSFLPVAATAESVCGSPATPISEVQGTGPASPLAGKTVTVEGILTQDSRSDGGFGGFYLQQADHQTDNDPATSEALFVYTDRDTGASGMRLRVTGKVKEYHGLTELVAVRNLRTCGKEALPAPVPLTLPWAVNPEHLENMRVAFRQPLTVVDNYNLARYGELALAASDQVQPTEYLPPGNQAHRQSARNRQNRVLLDDNRSRRDPRPVPWPPAGLSSATVRAGDRIDGLVGVLDFRFDAWRIQPAGTPVFLATNPRKPAPSAPAADSLRVLALNLGNYFNGDGKGGNFPTPRGAATMADFQRQQQRLIQTLQAPDPDILALTELENDGYGPHSAIASLASALGSQWRFVSTPGQDGDDEIRTGLLYRADRVSARGSPARLTGGPFRSQGRPPLAQDFARLDGDATVRVIVPHLKSKSCRGARGDESGSGRWPGLLHQPAECRSTSTDRLARHSLRGSSFSRHTDYWRPQQLRPRATACHIRKGRLHQHGAPFPSLHRRPVPPLHLSVPGRKRHVGLCTGLESADASNFQRPELAGECR